MLLDGNINHTYFEAMPLRMNLAPECRLNSGCYSHLIDIFHIISNTFRLKFAASNRQTHGVEKFTENYDTPKKNIK